MRGDDNVTKILYLCKATFRLTFSLTSAIRERAIALSLACVQTRTNATPTRPFTAPLWKKSIYVCRVDLVKLGTAVINEGACLANAGTTRVD